MNIQTAPDERDNRLEQYISGYEYELVLRAESSEYIGDYGYWYFYLGFENFEGEKWVLERRRVEIAPVAFDEEGNPLDDGTEPEHTVFEGRIVAYCDDAPPGTSAQTMARAMFDAFEEAGGKTGDCVTENWGIYFDNG